MIHVIIIFTRKVHEHVPSIMLIEAARQAMYHYVYNFTGYEHGEVSISMSNLNVEFMNYVESVFDLYVVVSQTDNIVRDHPKFIDKTAIFYQNGQIVAKIRLKGGVMKMKLFKRMRSLQINKNQFFRLSSRVRPEVVMNNNKGEVYIAQVNKISIDKVVLSSSDLIDDSIKNISFYVINEGFKNFPVENLKYENKNIIINFNPLSKDQSYQLKEMSKLHYFNCNDRTVEKELLLKSSTS